LEAQRSAFLNIMTGIMPDVKADYPDSYEYWLAYVENYESGQSLAPLPTVKSDAERYFLTSNQVYSTFYTIKAQEERLSKFRVIAPYSGLVTAAHVDRGTLVAPGQMLGTIISNGNYELEAAASIEVVAQLKIGDQISFSNNSLDGRWTGSVIRINDIVDPRTQNIPVYLDIWGEGLRVGMYLEGSVDGVAHKGVFAIPASVLTRDEKVLLLQDNTIGSKQVELVEMMEDSILVKGLTNDDLLVINSFEVPVEGLKLSL
ncbi:MAG: HlyD family efflux transporter periplasmic adaptor subunit, partial [Cyclobacteriaceae bacterium]|nr:HlyD family efflux transporter periplasmic adaptor subunit [Cyclobacteriaceae bacterium HetDA_MAG_MS6]